MANLWELPKTVSVNGKEYDIRTDFRAVLDVLTALSSKELKTNNKVEKYYFDNMGYNFYILNGIVQKSRVEGIYE